MPLRFVKYIILFAALVATLQLNAQKKSAEPPVCIVDEIMADSVNIVEMPEGLRDLIDYDAGTPVERKIVKPVNPKPYTVQVYGDKSRSEANARAAKVQARFPQYHVRRHYSSPYFRVYLGAFETSREAQTLVNEVKKAFPAFASEVHWTKTSIGKPSAKGGRR
ncbi:MAG: SPOR domain-containing protein [Firmicutes bacterium]|nr:SPOR domain-containing protein [Bacillota bacterium]MCM1401571.1 SPOR domain-containing protein [Bacteroides sp.]MCM1477265.1 SPOR domain-containing protein [Bacteroides sp.]